MIEKRTAARRQLAGKRSVLRAEEMQFANHRWVPGLFPRQGSVVACEDHESYSIRIRDRGSKERRPRHNDRVGPATRSQEEPRRI